MTETNGDSAPALGSISSDELGQRLEKIALTLSDVIHSMDKRTRAAKALGGVLDEVIELSEVVSLPMPAEPIEPPSRPPEAALEPSDELWTPKREGSDFVHPIEKVDDELEGVMLTDEELDYLRAFIEASCDPQLELKQFDTVFDDHMHASGISEVQVDVAMNGLDQKGFLRDATGVRIKHLPHELKLVAFEYVRRTNPGFYNKMFAFQLNIGGRGAHQEAIHIDDITWRQVTAQERFELLLAAHGELGTLAVDKVAASFAESGISNQDIVNLVEACRANKTLKHRIDRSGKYYDVRMHRVAFLKHRAQQLGYK